VVLPKKDAMSPLLLGDTTQKRCHAADPLYPWLNYEKIIAKELTGAGRGIPPGR